MKKLLALLATRSTHTISILVWNYDDNSTTAPASPVTLHIDGLPRNLARVLTTQFRIDDHHSDAYTVWQSMGSPQNPTPAQLKQLKAAGQLQLLTSPQWLQTHSGELNLSLTLPRQAMSLIRLHWSAPE
ncbi:MAG: GH39 family glycosyl hydrolase [Acidobacteriaceae bacterium]